MTEKYKSQLNIKIDPNLLVKLKSESIKSGKTLTAFVTELLEQVPIKSNTRIDILEKRLLRVEQKLNLIDDSSFNNEDDLNYDKSIFSDSGAKKYGEVAKELFDLFRNEKKISLNDAFAELSIFLAKYDSQPELVYEILLGKHQLTGLEMTYAYRNGSCGMRSALAEWTNSSLEPLNEAFLNAVDAKKLV